MKIKLNTRLIMTLGVLVFMTMFTPTSNVVLQSSAYIPIDGCPTRVWTGTQTEYTDQYLGRVELTDTAASSVKSILIEPKITDLRTDPTEQIFTSRYTQSSTLQESRKFSTTTSGSLTGKVSGSFKLFGTGIDFSTSASIGESSTESDTFVHSYTLSSSMGISTDVSNIDGNYNGQDIDAKFILHAVTYKADAYITKVNTLEYYWDNPYGTCEIFSRVIDSGYSIGYVVVDATEVFSVQEGVPYIIGNPNTPFYSITNVAYSNVVSGGDMRKEKIVDNVYRYQGSYTLSSSATTSYTHMSLTSNWKSFSASFSTTFVNKIKAEVSFKIDKSTSNTVSETNTVVVNDVISGTINCNPMIINAWRTVFDTIYWTGLCQAGS